MPRALRALVLATFALLLVTACGSSDDSGGGSGTVKLTFWTHTHPPMIAEVLRLRREAAR